MVGQLQADDGPAPGGPALGGVAGREQLQAAVVPAVGSIGIAQQGVDLLSQRTLWPGRLSTDRPVHRLPPTIRPGNP